MEVNIFHRASKTERANYTALASHDHLAAADDRRQLLGKRTISFAHAGNGRFPPLRANTFWAT
jgi:hypothetical protein